MSCNTPIRYETFVALWAGELPADEAERIEDHTFACDTCGAVFDQITRLVGTLFDFVPPVLTREMRDRFQARGFKIRELAFDAGARGEAFFAAELDLLVFALRGGLADVKRVDLEVGDDTGAAYFEFPNVPFDASRGEVLVACQQHYRQYEFLNRGDPQFRVFAVEAGGRRLIGAYTIKHVWPRPL
jgi:hypothetical protein